MPPSLNDIISGAPGLVKRGNLGESKPYRPPTLKVDVPYLNSGLLFGHLDLNCKIIDVKTNIYY